MNAPISLKPFESETKSSIGGVRGLLRGNGIAGRHG
jgi:hypothetical protein